MVYLSQINFIDDQISPVLLHIFDYTYTRTLITTSLVIFFNYYYAIEYGNIR
jgi:hypothetical protein